METKAQTALFVLGFVASVLLVVFLEKVATWLIGLWKARRDQSSLYTLRIGVVGFSAQPFDERRAKEAIRSCFDKLGAAAEKSGSTIEIVSGLTAVGIPLLAYTEAKRRGWKTAGIACAKAREMECFPCDRVAIVGKEWGDESDKFLSGIDMLVRFGGGQQSASEYERFTRMKMYYNISGNRWRDPEDVQNSSDDAPPKSKHQ